MLLESFVVFGDPVSLLSLLGALTVPARGPQGVVAVALRAVGLAHAVVV